MEDRWEHISCDKDKERFIMLVYLPYNSKRMVCGINIIDISLGQFLNKFGQ